MKNRKLLVAVIAVALIVALGVVGTIAWMLDEKSVGNTFTVGNVHLESLVETVATTDDDGSYEFHLIPGSTYDMTPVVTVKGTSEAAYVRVIVTFNDAADLISVLGVDTDGDDVKDAFLPHMYVAGWDDSVWETVSQDPADYKAVDDKVVVEFRYHEVVAKSASDTKLPAVFTTFTLPGAVTNEGLEALEGLSIDVVAQAIQAENLATADAAWAAFEAQAG